MDNYKIEFYIQKSFLKNVPCKNLTIDIFLDPGATQGLKILMMAKHP